MAEQNNPFNAMSQDLQDNARAEQQPIPRRSARRRHHAEAQQEAEFAEQQTQNQTQAPANQPAQQAPTAPQAQQPVDPAKAAEDERLTELFGPVDDNMTKIKNAVLTDIYPNDDDPTDGQKWLMLDFEYQPDDAVFGLKNTNFAIKPQTGTISLNTQVLKDPDADRDHREYVDNPERKQLIDNMIDYAFGKKFGIHNFEEMYQKFNAMLDDTSTPEITFDVYQSIFSVEYQGQRQYRTAYRLINRHPTSSFIQTDFVGSQIFKESALNDDRIPVKILQMNDNLNIYRKKDTSGNEQVYPFAQLELYVEYAGSNPDLHGKKYMIRYRYLRTTDGDGKAIPQAEQTPDFDKRLRQYRVIADHLGLTGDNKALIKQIEGLKNVNAFAVVQKSNLSYTGGEHRGEPIYYMKLA